MTQGAPNFRQPQIALDRMSLFLDFDGTLVELAERPDGVVVDRGLTDLLGQLASRLHGRLALVSGRSIAQLDTMLSGMKIAVAGSHGEEIRGFGMIAAPVRRPDVLDVVEAGFAHAFGDKDGVIIEVKTLGVAVHYRLNPAVGPAVQALAERLGVDHMLEVQTGKMMVELRSGEHDKGTAIAAMMRTAPFAGYVPVFLGDDVTDEDGFEACAALGGMGILVGEERPSAARYRLDGVSSVRKWLAAL
ncbi:MAG: trehalose-phosphatase [Sphingomonas bacterium]